MAPGVITDTGGYYTRALAADVQYYKVIPVYGQYIKLYVKGTGTVTNSSCAVYIMGVQ